jgi:type I restriction enzyme S subunit
MAIRARLAAPPQPDPEPLPALAPKWTTLPAHLFCRGDRRMEAENYLSTGYGLRLAIEERAVGWKRFGQMARVWQPSRLKGIQVGPEFGTPFLAATQVFDIRPVPRKWLALARTENAKARFVASGTILVTCSGAVGRSTIAHKPHSERLISHDLLRVDAGDPKQWGWLYAYLRTPQARAMMTGAQYGHIIKHLETSHLDALPVLLVRDEIAEDFEKRTQAILNLRNSAHQLALEAEDGFEKALSPLKVKDWGETGFEIRASAFFTRRRRLEASPHNPGVNSIRRHLSKHGSGFTAITDAGFDVWVPGRYKRIPAEDGVVYYDSADLLETNPDTIKRFADCDFGDEHNGRVDRNWLLMPSSGQVYGIIGSAVLAGASLDGQVVSNHVIRMAPKAHAKIRAGYVLVALTHPTLGRPLVKALAFGSSVPEIDPSEIREFPIVRLREREENSIADLAEKSATERAQADVLERELAADAGDLIERFLANDSSSFVKNVSDA